MRRVTIWSQLNFCPLFPNRYEQRADFGYPGVTECLHSLFDLASVSSNIHTAQCVAFDLRTDSWSWGKGDDTNIQICSPWWVSFSRIRVFRTSVSKVNRRSATERASFVCASCFRTASHIQTLRLWEGVGVDRDFFLQFWDHLGAKLHLKASVLGPRKNYLNASHKTSFRIDKQRRKRRLKRIDSKNG